MTPGQLISHEGRVVEADNNKLKVKIISLSACSSCHARGSCSAADMSEKYIDAFSEENIKKGEKVNVIIEEKYGWIALMYGIIVPFLILVTLLFTLTSIGESESFSALISLLSLAPYYFLLYLLRGRFEKKFVFRAEKI